MKRSFWLPNRRSVLKLVPSGLAVLAPESFAQQNADFSRLLASPPPEAAGKKWVAKWIWSQGEAVPQNFYLYLRKTLELNGEAQEATVDVAADSRYKLFVNGKFVGRGPARCDQRWQYYDTYDLRPFLEHGRNVVSAMVHQYGAPSHSYTLGRGGFLLQGEVRDKAGGAVRLDSDESWRVLPAPPWDRESSRTCVAVMWQEIYDARKEPAGWHQAGFDDSHWQRPAVLGTPPVLPWENLVPRDIPFLHEEEWLPVAIVNSGFVDPAPAAVRLDLPKLLGRPDGQVAYLFSYLKSPVAQHVAFAVRGREGMPPMMTQIWVNGEGPAQHSLNASTSLFHLRQGWNEILVKLGRTGPAWYWDLAFGPAPGETLAPIEWYAETESGASGRRAWILGPYGPGEAGQPAPEKTILGRTPGTPFRVPGKAVPLDFGPTKNIALLMAMEKRHPQSVPALQQVDKLLKPGSGHALIATGSGTGDPYLTLDFGKEVAGFVRLRLNGVAGGIVDLGYSETLADGHVDTLRDNWSFADRYIMRDGPQQWELFFWKGFRYLQLTFRNCSKPVEVESVKLLFTSYPVQYRGAFECSDPLLTKIWDVGRWTLQLCMHDGYEDCPWREQGQWSGDAQVELHSNYVTFGDVALGSKCLRQIAQSQNEEGALAAEYPADTMVYPTRHTVPSGIPTFMAQWVSMVLDHYRYTGDLNLVSELYPNLVRVMRYLGKFRDADGLLNNLPGFVFLDWAPGLTDMPGQSRGELTGMNCHYYRALRDAAEVAGLRGEETQKNEWLAESEKLKQAINDRLWSEQHGVYIRGRIEGQPIPKLAMHDSILAAYTGVAPADRVSTSFANLLGRPRPDVVPIGTPYFYFFYLRALRGAGRHLEALNATRQAYGEMLRKGATAWWEQFEGFASLCHAWSTAPNSDLSGYTLGVQVMAPGFAEMRVEPQPADLTWAKGVVPTPRGDVSVNWKREDARFELHVGVPMKSLVELSVPAGSLETTRLTGGTNLRKAFMGGRARYWVQAPGTFRVEVIE